VLGPAFDTFVLNAITRVLVGEHATAEKAVDAFVKRWGGVVRCRFDQQFGTRPRKYENREVKATVAMLADPSIDGLDELRCILADLNAKREPLSTSITASEKPHEPAFSEAEVRRVRGRSSPGSTIWRPVTRSKFRIAN